MTINDIRRANIASSLLLLSGGGAIGQNVAYASINLELTGLSYFVRQLSALCLANIT